MRFAWFLALKHLTHRKTQSLITVLGVAAGVAVLTTALSLTNGFTAGLIEATLRAVPHVTLTALDPEDAPRPEHPEIVAETPVLIAKALPATLALAFTSIGGPVYLVAAAVMNGWFLWGAWRIWRRDEGVAQADNYRVEKDVFRFSLLYLFVHFGALLADAALRATGVI